MVHLVDDTFLDETDQVRNSHDLHQQSLRVTTAVFFVSLAMVQCWAVMTGNEQSWLNDHTCDVTAAVLFAKGSRERTLPWVISDTGNHWWLCYGQVTRRSSHHDQVVTDG